MIDAACVVMAIIAVSLFHKGSPSSQARHFESHRHSLTTIPGSYIGLYPDGVLSSYAPVTAFTTATGVKPNVIVYYSGWLEPFQVGFASTAADHGAVPLVQINP